MKHSILICFIFILTAGCSEKQTKVIHNDFELSYWIDADLRLNNGRGYWHAVDSCQVDSVPTRQQITNACKSLNQRYFADKLYVVYHRQFETDQAKEIYTLWNECAKNEGITIVPTVVIECYNTPSSMNFSNQEICDLAEWSTRNININEFGIYDVYIRQAEGSAQDLQMATIKERIGNKLVRVGLQPGETLSKHCVAGVEDTWTAECQGLTNELWNNPMAVNGSDNIGRKLLESWVAERVDGESRRIVWDMIPVAWDYEKPLDEYGYVCPGDDALINDPPIDDRIELCHQAISESYPEAMLTPKFGGYSCDLHILEANSAGKPESPSFYEQLRKDLPYKGYFSSAMTQVSELYKKLRQQK